MSQSRLMDCSYYDPKAEVRLTVYADTVIVDREAGGERLQGIRFGGYPEMVRAMSDAIYGGATVDMMMKGKSHRMMCTPKGYIRQLSHDGTYATATLTAQDDTQTAEQTEDPSEKPRRCYIFCPSGDREILYEELDRKTAVPMIPAFRDYILTRLQERKELRQMEVYSIAEKMDAWVLELLPEDRNVVEVMEEGLKEGEIVIPGSADATAEEFEEINTVTDYLNTFGVTVADRIRNQFQPVFDPAREPLSPELLAINSYIEQQAGYSLYDAQLAVAEAVKRQLAYRNTAIICAECGAGKSKIGAAALGALHHKLGRKTFNLVMCPSHMTRKWVRELSETLPETYGSVVRSIQDLDSLYRQYEAGDKHVFAVFSKERARDGYMRYPAVIWSKYRRAFVCPDCMQTLEMEISEDGTKYTVPADSFYFQTEHKKNHACPHCGAILWAPVNSVHRSQWTKLGEYGWVYRPKAEQHRKRTKNEAVLSQLSEIMEHPDGYFPIRGARRRYPLSTYIKKKMKGQITGFICDELHQFNNASGQGDAMAELFAVSRYFVGMTATLINGYSSGIFHLLYRLVPDLMKLDGKDYQRPGVFDSEYGVVETTYEIKDGAYNSNRRSTKRKKRTKQLPGVSPLVFSRFLLEYTAFLSLTDMGKELPDYEEIPVPLTMPEDVKEAYKSIEQELQRIIRTDRAIAQRILSAYLGLLTVYPDQPYDQPAIVHPVDGTVLVAPESVGDFGRISPKEEKALEIVLRKRQAGEKVLLFTSWTRTDSQKKLTKLLRDHGVRCEVLSPAIPPEKREEWVEKQVKAGIDVLITNPMCVETGLDLNAFTTLVFYSLGYNLFTLRQASRRSWRINQTAPRVEVYLLYYAETMQAKAMKLMASKLAVAGIIEGTFSEEGLAAMSDVKDLTSQMAKELSLGIKDSVEDIASAFKKMAMINPDRKRQEVPKESVEPTVETPQTVEAAHIVLRRSAEELVASLPKEKKRIKTVAVDENQLSFFDFVA